MQVSNNLKQISIYEYNNIKTEIKESIQNLDKIIEKFSSYISTQKPIKSEITLAEKIKETNDLSKTVEQLTKQLGELELHVQEIITQHQETMKTDVCFLAGNEDTGSSLSLLPKNIVLKILMIKANILG